MAYIYHLVSIALITTLAISCAQSQRPAAPATARLLGTCEGCEAVFESGDKALSPVDTLPDFHSGGTKIKVSGVIYEADAKTPAEGVILYVYHTDTNGIYTPGPNAKDWERRHGYNRGWIKTGPDGRYTFFTIRPGTYPSRDAPAHMHVITLESTGEYYWFGDYYFSDDPLLTEEELYPVQPRGGTSGVLTLRDQDGILVGKRDFILRRNIP